VKALVANGVQLFLVGSSPEQFARDLPGEARERQAIVGKAGARLDDQGFGVVQ